MKLGEIRGQRKAKFGVLRNAQDICDWRFSVFRMFGGLKSVPPYLCSSVLICG